MASKDSTWIKVHFKKTKGEAGGTATVPRSWVSRTEMWSYWPNKIAAKKINKLIADCVKPPLRDSPCKGNWKKLPITAYGNIANTFEAADEGPTDAGSPDDQPGSAAEKHSSGSDGDVEETPPCQSQSRNRKVKQMPDFTSGAEFDLSEKEQSSSSQKSSQPVSQIPQDLGDLTMSQSFLSENVSTCPDMSVYTDIIIGEDELFDDVPSGIGKSRSHELIETLVTVETTASATPTTSTASPTLTTPTASAIPSTPSDGRKSSASNPGKGKVTTTTPADSAKSTPLCTPKGVKRPHKACNIGKSSASKPSLPSMQESPGNSSSEDDTPSRSVVSPSPMSMDTMHDVSLKKMMLRLLADNKRMRKEMQEGFASLQKQLLDTSSGAGEQQTVTDEETSAKWGVTLPVRTMEELDVLENQLDDDEDLQQKLIHILSTGDALETAKDVIQKRLQVVLKRPELMQYLNLGGQTTMPAHEGDEYEKRNFKKTVVYELLVKACTKVDANFNRTHFNAELSKYLKNAPNIKDGYNWVKKHGKKVKASESAKQAENEKDSDDSSTGED